ncbi:MAG: hypothetical protein LBQ95_02440 [Lachnospiraceae bacterium]|jgi:hypothetical protein|nr:hypothetical protein [Lachnospiraceae bacterium]
MNELFVSRIMRIADLLSGADPVLICGLGGISLENQHLAFFLARKIGAYTHVDKISLPTRTYGVAPNQNEGAIADGFESYQNSKIINSLGAYKVALAQGGGAFVSFCEGIPKRLPTITLDKLLSLNKFDVILQIGETAYDTKSNCRNYPNYYTINASLSKGETILREDGIPIRVKNDTDPNCPELSKILSLLISEVSAC